MSAIDQCIRCSNPFVGSTPRPYCGNTTGMPPLRCSKVSGMQLCIALQALLCRQVTSDWGCDNAVGHPLQAGGCLQDDTHLMGSTPSNSLSGCKNRMSEPSGLRQDVMFAPCRYTSSSEPFGWCRYTVDVNCKCQLNALSWSLCSRDAAT